MTFESATACSIFPLTALNGKVPHGTPGNYWINLTPFVMGLTDLRARSGTFNTPWNSISPFRQPLPDLTYPENRPIDELLDLRGQEIYQLAKDTNKRIMVMWSGGIDSTTVLVSMLKAIPKNEQKDLLVICISADSIAENLVFYQKFISMQIPVVHRLTVEFNNQFLDNFILLHGDPGDALFGPSIGRYKHLMPTNAHLVNYKDNIKLLYQCINPNPKYCSTNIATWFVDKICRNLLETNPSEITSVADWFWWQYFNFKWEGSLWRPFHSTGIRQNHKEPISQKNSIQYLQGVFFHTDYFQRWSYTNLKTLVPSANAHKKAAKDYIFEFDKNELYYQNKTKVASMPLHFNNGSEKNYWTRPVFYNQDWVGYTLNDPGVYDIALSALLGYNG